MFNNCDIAMRQAVMIISADVSENARLYVPFFTFCHRYYGISRAFRTIRYRILYIFQRA